LSKLVLAGVEVDRDLKEAELDAVRAQLASPTSERDDLADKLALLRKLWSQNGAGKPASPPPSPPPAKRRK
jgi:hypothetical protein